MIRTPGRRLLTCYHEAGHAVARWWLGHIAYEAVVLTVDEVRAGVTIAGRRGREQRAEGAVNGYDLVEPHMQGQERALRTEMNFVEMFAGPMAEARYRRQSVAWCLFEGGGCDLAEIARLRSGGFRCDAEGAAAERRAEQIAKTLIRSPKAWAAVQAVACTLHEAGRANGLQIDAACTTAYGAPFAYDRWAETWPPASAQIRSGFLPQTPIRRGSVTTPAKAR